MSTALTLRVSCIPSSIDAPQFISIFEDFIKKNSPPEEGKVGKTIVGSSFAPAATSADSEVYRTATVTVRRVPEVIRNVVKSGDELELEADGECFSVLIDTDFIGLTPLNTPQADPTVDIIAVTGLAGHAFGSWKARGGTTMWLRDLLPANLPSARILTYGYDSKLLGSESNSSILDFAKRFLEAVKTSRMAEEELRRPMIFIGYSLGGLVIKQALVDASRGSDSDKLIPNCSYGLLLFGVPNRGLQVDALRSMVKGQPNGRLIEDLDPESRTLRMLHDNFAISFNFVDSQVISFFETKRTRTVVMGPDGVWKRVGELVQMVTQDSATWFGPHEKRYDQLPIDADHSNIPKFQNRSNVDYITIRQKLIGMVEKGPAVITKRFGLSPEVRQSMETLLCPVDFKKDTVSWSHDRCEGTGDWLLSDPVFERWQDMEPSKVLWLKGGPGSGKTYLMSRVLEHSKARLGEGVAVAFFFCDNKTQNLEKRAMPSIVRTLLAQLLIQIPPQHRVDFEICVQHISNYPADNQAAQLFKDTFKIVGQHLPKVFLIIDALDECEDGDLFNLIAFLDGLRSIQTTGFQVILSGRSSIQKTISDSAIDIHVIPVTPEGVRHDITTFVSSKVREFHIGEREDEDATTQKITERCETFLLARLHLTSLKHLHIKTQKKLDEALSGLPKEISHFYKQTFGRQKNFDVWERRLVRKVFMWVIYAKRPLRLKELAEAVSEEHPNGARSYLTARDLDDYCGGLVVLKTQDGCSSTSEALVELLHRTVKDYVIGFEWEIPLRSTLSDSDQCISEIFRTSITYMYNLKVEQVGTKGDEQGDKPFLEYVYGFWILSLLDLDNATPTVLDILAEFLGSEACYSWWDSPMSAALNGTREARRSLRLRFRSWVTTYTNENPNLGQHVDFMTAHQKKQVVRYTDLEGEGHPSTLNHMDSLADTYLDEGQWGEARSLYERSLAICEEKNDSRSLVASSNLARVFGSQGRWRDASKLQKHVLETYRKIDGESGPRSIAAAAELGRTYNYLSYLKDAEELQEYVVRVSKENHRENHPDSFRAIRDLARTYKDQRRWEEAEQLLKDVLTSSRKVFGGDHVETIAAMRDLARTYAIEGRPDDAEQLQLEVVSGYDKAFGEDHAESLVARLDLSYIHLMQRRMKEAAELAQLVLDTRKRVLGKDHYLTVYSTWYLSYTLFFEGSWIRAAGKFISFSIKQLKVYVDNVTLTTLGLAILPGVTWRTVEIGGRSFPIPDDFSYRALEFDGWNLVGETPMVACTALGKYMAADTVGLVDRQKGFYGLRRSLKEAFGQGSGSS